MCIGSEHLPGMFFLCLFSSVVFRNAELPETVRQINDVTGIKNCCLPLAIALHWNALSRFDAAANQFNKQCRCMGVTITHWKCVQLSPIFENDKENNDLRFVSSSWPFAVNEGHLQWMQCHNICLQSCHIDWYNRSFSIFFNRWTQTWRKDIEPNCAFDGQCIADNNRHNILT